LKRDEAGEFGRADGVPAVFEEDEAGVVSRRNGTGGSVGELCSLVEPHYPNAGNGRRPVGVERMLRVYFLEQWFSLSDPAVEEALYDSPLMRRFAQIDLDQPVPVTPEIAVHASDVVSLGAAQSHSPSTDQPEKLRQNS
jgi:hypothetical protein